MKEDSLKARTDLSAQDGSDGSSEDSDPDTRTKDMGVDELSKRMQQLIDDDRNDLVTTLEESQQKCRTLEAEKRALTAQNEILLERTQTLGKRVQSMTELHTRHKSATAIELKSLQVKLSESELTHGRLRVAQEEEIRALRQQLLDAQSAHAPTQKGSRTTTETLGIEEKSAGSTDMSPEGLPDSDYEDSGPDDVSSVDGDFDRDIAIALQLDRELNEVQAVEKGNVDRRAQTELQVQSTRSLWPMSLSSNDGMIDKLKEKIRSMQKKLEDSQITCGQFQKALRHEQLNHSKTWNAAKAFDMELTGARRQIHLMEKEIKGLRFELGGVKQPLSDAVCLSEVGGKELKAAQVFLAKADTLSRTDVIQKVNALNEEVFQASALLAEILQYETPNPAINRRAVNSQSREMLGDHLTNMLGAQSPTQRIEPNPLLIQIVMQVALTRWCASIGSSWKPGDGATAQILKSLYTEIRKTEDQGVAGRWRSIAKPHIRYRTEEWNNSIMPGILAVMHVSGWATRDGDQLQQFEKGLPSIFTALQDLRKAIGEDVTSCDLEIAVIDPGAQFDPANMEDAYADGRASEGKEGPVERVIGTSGLGLRRIVVKRSSKGLVDVQAEILSQPKVVLEGTIKELIEPPPPPKPKRKKPAGGSGWLPFCEHLYSVSSQ